MFVEYSSFFADLAYPLVDMTHLTWKPNLSGESTGGSFYKATEIVNKIRRFYKLSQRIGTELVGHESINEVIVSRLLDILEIPHVEYRLINGRILLDNKEYTTQFTVSDDFLQPNEMELHLDQLYGNIEMSLPKLIADGYEQQIAQMFLVDFLIINRDRHAHNISFAFNQVTKRTRLIPWFDHGFCFAAHLLNDWDSMAHFNVMRNNPVNNAIGSQYLFDNLELIQNPVRVKPLRDAHAEILIKDLGTFVPDVMLKKCLEAIYKRYEYAKDKNFLVEEP